MKTHVLGHISLKDRQCVKNTQLTFLQLGNGEAERIYHGYRRRAQVMLLKPTQVKLLMCILVLQFPNYH